MDNCLAYRKDPAQPNPLPLTVRAHRTFTDENENQTVIYASCTNFIDIADINDNAPRFSSAKYTARFSRLTKVGDIIDVVHAEDKDAGENATISYSLRELEDGDATVNFTDYFEVNATSGAVKLAKLIDPSVISNLTKITGEVVATDGGNPPRSTAALVEIRYSKMVWQFPDFSYWSLALLVSLALIFVILCFVLDKIVLRQKTTTNLIV